MRQVLPLGLLLLALVLLLDLGAPAPDGGARRAVPLVAAARGPMLPPAPYGSGPERPLDVILVGERSLRADGRGLHVAVLDPPPRLAGHRTYDVARSPADAQAFVALCEGAAPGSVLVLASGGRLRPTAAGAGGLEELRDAARSLGTQLDPLASDPCSWAMVTLRERRGWRPLAEAFSRETGVCLAFPLALERSAYDGHRCQPLVRRIAGTVRLPLHDELPNAARATPGVVATLQEKVGGVRRRSLLAPPLAGASDRTSSASAILWEDVALGGGAAFHALLGLADDAPGARAVDFVLVVDGSEAGRRRVEPGAPAWIPWRVDLAAWSDRTVSLELRVEAPPGSPPPAALWGEPLLLYGPRR